MWSRVRDELAALPSDVDAAGFRREEALVSVVPLDAVRHSYRAFDDLHDLAVARGRPDVLGVDDDAIAGLRPIDRHLAPTV